MLPLDPLHGTGYLFWSGIGSDIFIVTGLAALLRHVNCHVTGCPRIGHRVEGTSYRACNRHHPRRPQSGPITAVDIDREHKRAKLKI